MKMQTCLKALDGADTINGNGGDDTILPNRPAGVNDMGVAVANTAANDANDQALDADDRTEQTKLTWLTAVKGAIP